MKVEAEFVEHDSVVKFLPRMCWGKLLLVNSKVDVFQAVSGRSPVSEFIFIVSIECCGIEDDWGISIEVRGTVSIPAFKLACDSTSPNWGTGGNY